MTGNTGNTGNVGNAGSGGGNATAISTGWFFADREDLPFVTEHSSSAGFIARQLRPIENFGEHNWSADWFAYRVLIQFGLGHLAATDPGAPPSFADTEKEIAELVKAAQNERSDALGEILGESSEFISYFLNLLMATPSSYPQTVRVLKAANLIATVYQMHWKEVYNRARPTQVCPALFPPIAVPGHASYPSGHSTQAHLLALCLGDVFAALPAGQPSPAALIADLDVLARRIARNREIAGLHFPSDSKAGETLAKAIHGLLTVTAATSPALYKDAVAAAAKGVDMVTNTQPPSGASGLPPGIVVFPIPDPGFNPETATAQKLAEYGIIPRPDPQSVLFHSWRRLFRAPVTFVDPKPQSLVPSAPPPSNPSPDAALQEEPSPDIPQVPAAGAGSRFSHSENWSGGYIVPTGGTMVVQVAAAWTLPKLSLPEGGDKSVTYVCSTWVGLDGQRLYLNSSLPQIGVMQALLGTEPSPLPPVTAFCQWWDRQGVQDPIITLAGLPVSEGDEVIGSVWVQTDTSVICHLRNVTTGKLAVVGMDAPAVILHAGSPIQLTVSGATAEWVLERPSVPGSTAFYPFPRYEKTQFDVWAAVAGSAGPPQEQLDLGRSRLIALFDTPLDPARTAFVSMPRRKGDSVFDLTYGGFNPK